MTSIDLVFEDERWKEAGLESLATTAIPTALTHLDLDPAGFELTILACDDDRISGLNAAFRGKRDPTNVLSWPEEDRSAESAGAVPPHPESDGEDLIYLGDVAIAFETCTREADEQHKPFSAHVTHLIVHGLLHLLGYDHMRDADATLMERREIEILGKLGLPDPYTV